MCNCGDSSTSDLESISHDVFRQNCRFWFINVCHCSASSASDFEAISHNVFRLN